MPREFLLNLNIMRKSMIDKTRWHYSLFGKMTDIQIWDEVKLAKFMLDWVNCETDEEGSLLPWSTTWWELEDLFEVEVRKELFILNTFNFAYGFQNECIEHG